LDQELISYRYSFCCSCSCCYHWGDSLQKATLRRFIAGMEFGKNGLQGNTMYASFDGVDLTSHFQGRDHDLISHRRELPPGDCSCSVCPANMQQRSPVPDA